MLLNKRDVYRPINYPKAVEFWKKQQQMHWLVDEIAFAEDVKDWNTKLKPGEKNLLSKLFRFFVQGDQEITDVYTDKYMGVLGGQPEVKMMMTAFANSETIHVVSYAKLLDTVGMPDAEFSAFKQYKEMMAKYDYLQSFDPKKFDKNSLEGKKELAKSLAVYSGFTEGMMLYSSFAILFNFSRHGQMKGMGKVIEWSARDEALHAEGMTWVFRTFIKENPEIWTDDFKKEIYQICREMVKLEDGFIDLCFKEAGEINGLKAEDVKKYIRFIADRRLADLGLKSNYHVKENPLPWMDFLFASSHTNFFEDKVTEYQKAPDLSDMW